MLKESQDSAEINKGISDFAEDFEKVSEITSDAPEKTEISKPGEIADTIAKNYFTIQIITYLTKVFRNLSTT